MIQQAIIKINAEMQRNASDRYTEAIGHHVIDACTTEANATAILDQQKTLKGAMDAVRKEAQSKAKGGVAVMDDGEVYAIVDQYFGLTTAPAAPAHTPAPAQKQAAVSLDIDDFF